MKNSKSDFINKCMSIIIEEYQKNGFDDNKCEIKRDVFIALSNQYQYKWDTSSRFCKYIKEYVIEYNSPEFRGTIYLISGIGFNRKNDSFIFNFYNNPLVIKFIKNLYDCQSESEPSGRIHRSYPELKTEMLGG